MELKSSINLYHKKSAIKESQSLLRFSYIIFNLNRAIDYFLSGRDLLLFFDLLEDFDDGLLDPILLFFSGS